MLSLTKNRKESSSQAIAKAEMWLRGDKIPNLFEFKIPVARATEYVIDATQRANAYTAKAKTMAKAGKLELAAIRAEDAATAVIEAVGYADCVTR